MQSISLANLASWPARVALGMCLAGLVAACSTVPLPQPTAAPSAEALAARIASIRAHKTPLHSLHAEARLLVLGPQGRLRGRVDIWVSRPDSVRFTMLSPQGGPLMVLCCDGETLRLIDMAHAHYLQAPATSETLDELLNPMRLHLDAAAWVALFLGEVDVPTDAQPAADAHGTQASQALRWSMPGGLQVWARFALHDGRLEALTLCHAEHQVADIVVADYDSVGVPHTLSIAYATHRAEVSLSQLEADLEAPPGTFAVAKPKGFS